MLHIISIYMLSSQCKYVALDANTLFCVRLQSSSRFYSLSGIGWRQPKIVYKYIKFQTNCLRRNNSKNTIILVCNILVCAEKKNFFLSSSFFLFFKKKSKKKTQLSSVIESSWMKLFRPMIKNVLCSTIYFVMSLNYRRRENIKKNE